MEERTGGQCGRLETQVVEDAKSEFNELKPDITRSDQRCTFSSISNLLEEIRKAKNQQQKMKLIRHFKNYDLIAILCLWLLACCGYHVLRNVL